MSVSQCLSTHGEMGVHRSCRRTVPPAPTTTGTTDTGDALNPSTTEPSNQDNGASPSTGIQAGFFAGLALLGAFLA